MDIAKFDITIKNLLIISGAVILLILLYRLQLLVTTFAVSFFIAYLFDPVIDWLEDRNFSRMIAILLLYFFILLLLLFFLSYLLPILYNEMVYLVNELPVFFKKLLDLAEKMAGQFNIDISLDRLREIIIPKIGTISQGFLNTFNEVLSSLNAIIRFILYLALIPILTFYFLKDFDWIRDKMFESFSKRGWTYFPEYFMKFNLLLSRYFRGQIIVALILGLLYTGSLLIAEVKPSVLLGMTSGILCIVPYLGFIVGLGIAIVLAIVQHGDLLHPAMVVVGFGIVQLLESNVITPKIVGGTLNLHPTVVIFALMAGGSLMGISGMIIALPIAAFLKILLSESINGNEHTQVAS